MRDRERKKAYDKARRDSNLEHFKEYDYNRRYGITIADVEDMFNKQGGTCAICGVVPNKGALAVDHCHTTDKVRGLLCHNCNLGLGNFKDNINLLSKAIQYLTTT